MDQPQENPNIPVNLVKAIDAVRNKISIGEAEVLRLKDLVRAETYTVSQLTNSRKALEDEMIEIEIKHKEAKSKLDATTKDVDKSDAELSKIRSAASDVLRELDGVNESKNKLMEVIKTL